MGCQKCNNTGYRGRIAIHEILVVDNHVRRMIIEHAPVEDIKKYAREVRKMRTLRESALQLVGTGSDHAGRDDEDQLRDLGTT